MAIGDGTNIGAKSCPTCGRCPCCGQVATQPYQPWWKGGSTDPYAATTIWASPKTTGGSYTIPDNAQFTAGISENGIG